MIIKRLLFFGLLLATSSAMMAMGPMWSPDRLQFPDGRTQEVDYFVVNGNAGMCNTIDLVLRDKSNPDITKPPYWQSTIGPTDSLELRGYLIDKNGKRHSRGQVTLIKNGVVVQNKVPVAFEMANYNDPSEHFRVACMKIANGREEYVKCSDVLFYMNLQGPLYSCTSGRDPRLFDPLGLGAYWKPTGTSWKPTR